MAIRNIAVLVGASLLVAGCISFGKDVPEQLISLTPRSSAPVGEMGSGSIENAIAVLDPDTSRQLDVTRVPVQVDAANIAYLKDAIWVEKPGRQLRRLLAEAIRERSGRLVVEGSDYEIKGKSVLSGRLLEMGYDARRQAVVVRFDGLLQDGAGITKSRRFEAIVPGIPATAAAVAPALNDAANDVADQVAQWVAG